MSMATTKKKPAEKGSSVTRAFHELRELIVKGHLSPGSWIVVMDGYIMELVAGGPRTKPGWEWDNPKQAAAEFVVENPDFVLEEPEFPFNESPLTKGVTYFRGGYLRRVR